MVPWKAFRRSAPFVATSFLMICSAGAFCQQSSQGTEKGSSSGNSQSQSSPPAPANSGNAFPESQSEAASKAAQQSQQSAPNPSTQKTGTNGSSPNQSSTARDNPFPEAQSKAAAKPDTGSAQPSGAATPSSGGYSSSDAHLPPPAVGQGDLTSHTKLDSYTRDQTEDGHIEDDLNVANLYMKNGNYRGAYLRYRDTLQYDPQNDTALYGVAEAMCRENLTAEAMAHFKSYAKDNPQGKYALKAEKMLAHPNKCMHNF